MFRWMMKMVDEGRGEELRQIMEMEVIIAVLVTHALNKANECETLVNDNRGIARKNFGRGEIKFEVSYNFPW